MGLRAYDAAVHWESPHLATLAAELVSFGLDLLHPFRVAMYNAGVEAAYRLPDYGRPDCLAVLVANTRALWPHFLAGRRAEPDPLDRWVARRIQRAASQLEVGWEVWLEPDPPPRRLPLQRLASLSGFAWLAPSHLVLHPIYGPWVALRGVVVIDAPGPPPVAPLDAACGECAQACKPALAAALAATSSDPIPSHGQVVRGWRRWVAVRDACRQGQEHRYGEQQLRYHYTWDPAILDEP